MIRFGAGAVTASPPPPLDTAPPDASSAQQPLLPSSKAQQGTRMEAGAADEGRDGAEEMMTVDIDSLLAEGAVRSKTSLCQQATDILVY